MNAKKIMGAVLVALLAVTAFAGVAAADPIDIGSVPAYTNVSMMSPAINGLTFVGPYIAEDGSAITPVDDGTHVYFAEEGSALGKVYKGLVIDAAGQTVSVTFTLVAPTAPVSFIYNGVSILGKTVSKDVADAADVITPGNNYVFIKDGVVYEGSSNFQFTPGEWAVAADLTGQTGIGSSLVIIGQSYSFTVAKTDSSITAVKDVVNIGENIVIEVLVPGEDDVDVIFDASKVSYDNTKVQAGVTYTTGTNVVNVKLGLDGTGSVAFKAEKKGDADFTLDYGKEPEVTVKIQKGVITAVADEDVYYIGNPIGLSGTTTAGDDLFFYIEGTNFDFMRITDAMLSELLEVENGAWTVEIDSNDVKQSPKTLVAGTYTVVVSTVEADGTTFVPNTEYKTLKEYAMSETYGTAAVTLTQPFITDVKAAAVAVQGTDYKITGTAIAAAEVNLYVFGTSYFVPYNTDTDDDEEFEFTISGVTTEGMAPGTYFYLIQHPMNDKIFNVWNETDGDFFYQATNKTGDKTAGKETFIFNVWTRGTNFAAQALLEAIAGQDIDDVFVQGTFEVEAQKLTINPIPAEVAKGTALTISGSTNSGEGVEVIVNVLAGKFGATIKGDENSATFLTAKAVTEEDGTFEAAIDTSKLEVGSYIVTVEIAGTMYDSAAVEIVDKAPVTPPADDKPDTPVTPPADDKPTEPETPGFGALAALAGLGAVAVLLLRRE